MTEIINNHLTKKNISDFRGSAPPIKYKDGWLMTIHHVYHNDPRKYFHRFVFLNKNFELTAFSRSFYFNFPSIEFNLSICHSENGLLITFSQNDSNSTLALVDYTEIDKMLGIDHHQEE